MKRSMKVSLGTLYRAALNGVDPAAAVARAFEEMGNHQFFASFHASELILCLISGGTSSLMAKPRPGLSLHEKCRTIRRLASSGASIVELNRLRSRLSSVKAGRLGQAT